MSAGCSAVIRPRLCPDCRRPTSATQNRELSDDVARAELAEVLLRAGTARFESNRQPTLEHEVQAIGGLALAHEDAADVELDRLHDGFDGGQRLWVDARERSVRAKRVAGRGRSGVTRHGWSLDLADGHRPAKYPDTD
jgi:hypothetical protein